MCDETHVVCVDTAEGSETVAHDGEKSDEDVVDDVYEVVFSGTADVDPSCFGQRGSIRCDG